MMTNRIAVIRMACALTLIFPIVAHAQDTIIVRRSVTSRGLFAVARRAVEFFNAGTTTRVFGRLTVGVDDVYAGDLAVVDGPLVVAGVIQGDLVAINARVELRATADVWGDILIVGGSLSRSVSADVRGSIERHRARAVVRRDRDFLVLVEVRGEQRQRPRVRHTGYSGGDATLVLTTAFSYNRVEGLPILFGPRIEWGAPYVRGRVQALGIARTAGDFTADRRDVGYTVEGSVRAGPEWPAVTLGAKAFDVVASIESWQLEDDEIGVGTFFLHRDYRDYYLSRGFGGFVEIEPARRLTLSGEVSRVEESSIAARDPWTLFRRDELWRANPAIDGGTFTRFTAALDYDSRWSRRHAASGWLLRAEWERGMSDDVSPRLLPLAVRDPLPRTGYVYDRLFVDLRRYLRVGWSGQLRLRAVGAGTFGEGDPLPVQRRLSLGGPDPMPGFGFRRFACNEAVLDPSVPALCDRIFLFQAEYRGGLSLGVFETPFTSRRGSHSRGDWDDGYDWDDLWWDGPQLVLFTDGGAGWVREDRPDELHWDVGAGLEFGSVGIYGAKAITEDESLRVILRLHHRF
ncbi:MAG: hypothetical protein ACE5PT_00795 [Gemmatimonadales bacterium]